MFQAPRRERLHLANRNRIETFQAIALRKFHVNELGIHVLQIGEHEELFERRVVAHVAVEIGIGIAPLTGGQTEEGDIEQVGFAGVGGGGLFGGDLGGDQVRLDSVGVEAVVDLGEGAVEVPGQREAAVFVFLEALEFSDEVEFEFDGDPGREFEGNVPVSESATVATGFGNDAYGCSVFDPLARSQHKAVETCPISKPLEFEGFKIRVIQALPNAKEFHGVPVSHPILDDVIRACRFFVLRNVRERDVVLIPPPNHSDFRAANLDFGIGGLLFHAFPSFRLRSFSRSSMAFKSSASASMASCCRRLSSKSS